jgi:hypothetical protein
LNFSLLGGRLPAREAARPAGQGRPAREVGALFIVKFIVGKVECGIWEKVKLRFGYTMLYSK